MQARKTLVTCAAVLFAAALGVAQAQNTQKDQVADLRKKRAALLQNIGNPELRPPNPAP